MRGKVGPVLVAFIGLALAAEGFAQAGEKEGEAKPESKAMSVDIGGGLTIEFVLIQPGSFLMGDRFNGPVHKVTLTKGCYLGKYEVTQEQWEAVTGANPSEFKGKRNPVESVSWVECQGFLRKLNKKLPDQNFRLPTEAEWEYACLAGSKSGLYLRDQSTQLAQYAWFRKNSNQRTHPVGEKDANAWGLYDMQGNVWEWCSDFYGPYPTDEQKDPVGPPNGNSHVLRGGGWGDNPFECRPAERYNWGADVRGSQIGFRIVRPLP